jgi:DNA-binding PadR family transcriptional regulator
MLNHGEITNSKSSFYKAHYYTVIWYLKKVGIVECFGVDEANEKRWRLTEKGKQLAIHLKAIIDMFQEKV